MAENQNPTSPDTDFKHSQEECYKEICTSFHTIEDTRFKVLGLLPFVTTSSFLLLIFSDPPKNKALLNLVLPFGLSGAFVTLGLFLYEIHHLRSSTLLAACGKKIEESLGINGPFSMSLPNIFLHLNAAGLIYATTFSAWLCLALWFALPGSAILITLVIFFLSLPLSMFLLQRIPAKKIP